MITRKRNCRLEVCFTKDELEALTKKARKARLSKGAFVRSAVNSVQIREAPAVEFYELMRALKANGSSIEQLLKLLDSKGSYLVPEIEAALEHNRKTEERLWAAYQMDGG